MSYRSESLGTLILQLLNSIAESSSVHGSRFTDRGLEQLNAQTAYCVLAVGAFMKRSGIILAAEQHCWFNRLLCAGVSTEGDLRLWLHESFPAFNANRWDSCRNQADKFLETGVSVLRWAFGVSGHGSSVVEPCPPAPSLLSMGGRGDGDKGVGGAGTTTRDSRLETRDPFLREHCPAVLFCEGAFKNDLPLVAVFNSRKPRLVCPDSNWLMALRCFFGSLESSGIALLGSTGTLTYDLVAAHAMRSGLPQLLVAPFPLLNADGELLNIYGEGPRPVPVFSCMLEAGKCFGKRPSLCRDRILAVLADLHVVLEIRSGGNLLAVLEEIQAESPRPQLVFDPGDRNSSSAGNYVLFAKFPENAHRFDLSDSADLKATPPVQSICLAPSALRAIPWGDYLFHYSRACAGPWPGQSYHDYLIGLLDRRPLSGHSALETLIRILDEGRIRAGRRMVRGNEAVVSWSSHPPHELFLMRKWNRTLARWTVEPYGVAARRDILRSLGAKPAVYGSEKVYQRLAEPEKYRFQLSLPTKSGSWKQEREWRLYGDLELDKILVTACGLHVRSTHRVGGQKTYRCSPPGFVFVQTEEEKAKVCSHINPSLPVVVLNTR